MHGGAHQHLGGFHLQMSRLATAVENNTQQLVYFARDLLLDGFRRFFSSGEIAAATGRARQIFSLTSRNSWLSGRKGVKASTPRGAFPRSTAAPQLPRRA